MYEAILIAAGYIKHFPTVRNSQCWIKHNYSDINVDTATGLWANEFDHSGITAASLSDYLANNNPPHGMIG